MVGYETLKGYVGASKVLELVRHDTSVGLFAPGDIDVVQCPDNLRRLVNQSIAHGITIDYGDCTVTFASNTPQFMEMLAEHLRSLGYSTHLITRKDDEA